MVSSPKGEIQGCLAQDENQTPGKPFKVLKWCFDTQKPCEDHREDGYKCTKTWLVRDLPTPSPAVKFPHTFIAYTEIPIKGDALEDQVGGVPPPTQAVCMQAKSIQGEAIHVVTLTHCDDLIVQNDPHGDLKWHPRSKCMYAEDNTNAITAPEAAANDPVRAKSDDKKCFQAYVSTNGGPRVNEGYFLVSSQDGTFRGCVAQDNGQQNGTDYKILTYCDKNGQYCSSPDTVGCTRCPPDSGDGYKCYNSWKTKVYEPHGASSLIV